MANTTSAKKQARQNLVRRQKNLARKTSIKTAIKKVYAAIESSEDAEKMKFLLKDVEAKLARAKGKHTMHPKTASRKISRLAKKVNAASSKK